jgi:hypothetical protein
MKKINSILLYTFSAAISLFLWACSDIISEDLDKDAVFVEAPGNGIVSSEYTQTFIWREVEGADEYQLRIVKPNFTQIQQIVLDTNITGLSFTYNLYPGEFEWGIRAKNNTSETDWFIRKLTIDSSANLTGSTVILTAPAEGVALNDSSITFSWQALQNADDYKFKLVEGADFESGVLVEERDLTGTSISVNVSKEGTYSWGVRGQNELTNSPFAVRTFSIDNSAPPRPSITSPTNGSIVFSPVAVAWAPQSTGAIDSVFISADSTFATYEEAQMSDSLKSTLSVTAGVKYIKVKRRDQAGNKSADSEVVQITVQ